MKGRPVILLGICSSLIGCGARSELLVPEDAGATAIQSDVTDVSQDAGLGDLAAFELGITYTNIAQPYEHSLLCALYGHGAVSCWGNFSDDSISLEGIPPPGVVVPGISVATEIAVGGSSACAILAGSVSCWGNNEHGQLGVPGALARFGAVSVAGLPLIRAIRAQGDNTCALAQDGRVFCWGAGWGSAPAGSAAPRVVDGLPPVVDLSVGRWNACALTATGNVWCWGSSVRYLSGVVSGNTLGAFVGDPLPVSQVPGLDDDIAVRVFAGDAVDCIETYDGRVLCWGFCGAVPSLGDSCDANGDVLPSPAPAERWLADATDVAVGFDTGCVIVGGGMRCWGGAPGDGSRVGFGVSLLTPRPVIHVCAQRLTNCMMDTAHDIYCWGWYIDSGGNYVFSFIPQLVASHETLPRNLFP